MENSLSSMQIKMTFVTKEDIYKILYKYKAQMQFDIEECENQTSKNKVAKSYRQKLFTALSIAFRRQIILSTEEAIKFYSNDDYELKQRMDLFFEIIEFIQDEMNMDFIPDRLFVCAFFRISAETYQTILVDPRADISQNLKNQIHNLEEFIISMTTNGLEQGVVNGFAWRKMQLKAEYGGNEIKAVESYPQRNAQLVITTREDVQKRMGTNYNFPELQQAKKEDN